MRYILRNPAKVQQHLGHELFMRVVNSLKSHFYRYPNEKIKFEQWAGEPYPILIVADAGHTTNDIAFYVVFQEGDWIRLAFKEFIG